LAQLLLSAGLCGCTPTAPHGPTFAIATFRGHVSGNGASCGATFRQVRPHVVIGSVTPGSLSLEVRTGTCGDSGQVVGRSDTGALSLELGRGPYQVWIINDNREPAAYSLIVQYLAPGA
jgi:hypothetical protein